MRLAHALLAIAYVATPVSADDTRCATEIATAVDAALTSGPVRMKASATMSTGAWKVSGEVVPPDSMHFVFDEAGETTEFIMLGDKAWMKAAGAWSEFSSDIAAQMTENFQLASPEQLALMSDAHCYGLTTVDGRSLLSYSFALKEDEGTISTNRVFVDPVHKAPVRLEADLDFAGTKGSIRIDYVYDPTVTIAAPAL